MEDPFFHAIAFSLFSRISRAWEESNQESNRIKGLPTYFLDRLCVFTPNINDEVKECTICLESMTHSTECRKLLCTHAFHKGCIDKWLGEKYTCPMCRNYAYEKDLDPESVENEEAKKFLLAQQGKYDSEEESDNNNAESGTIALYIILESNEDTDATEDLHCESNHDLPFIEGYTHFDAEF